MNNRPNIIKPQQMCRIVSDTLYNPQRFGYKGQIVKVIGADGCRVKVQFLSPRSTIQKEFVVGSGKTITLIRDRLRPL
jgi:hypothetical protein